MYFFKNVEFLNVWVVDVSEEALNAGCLKWLKFGHFVPVFIATDKSALD